MAPAGSIIVIIVLPDTGCIILKTSSADTGFGEILKAKLALHFLLRLIAWLYR